VAKLETTMKEVTDLQQDTQVWRAHMIRNNDALAKWKKAREEELAFQRNVVGRLDGINNNLDRMSCAVCIAAGTTSCRKFCVLPKTKKAD